MQFPRQLLTRSAMPRLPANLWQASRWHGIERFASNAELTPDIRGRPVWLVLSRSQLTGSEAMASHWMGQGMTVLRSGVPSRGEIVAPGTVDEGFVYQLRPVLVISEKLLHRMPIENWRHLSGAVILGDGQSMGADWSKWPGLMSQWRIPMLILLPPHACWSKWSMCLAELAAQANTDVGLERVTHTQVRENPALWSLISDWWLPRFSRG